MARSGARCFRIPAELVNIVTESFTTAGAGRGSRPKGLKPRLLVLCGHEPTLDPRIDWAARAAARDGFDVRVHGFTIGKVDPKFVDPPEYTTSRGRAEDAAGRSAETLRILVSYGLVPRWLFWAGPALATALAALWVLYRLVLAPWIILDWVLERLGAADFTSRPIESLAKHLKLRLLKALRYWPRRAREGLRGYKWYFKELIFQQAVAALSRFEEDNWKPDIIHANDPDCLLAANLLRRRFAARLVYDAHEYGPEAYLTEPTPRGLFFAYETRMLKGVDAAATVTPQIAAKFQRRYTSGPAFAVVPNATPTPSSISPLDDPFVRLAARGRVRVLFQGGFAENRGVEELIDAWREIDESKAVLFIRGPENLYRESLISHAFKTGRVGSSIFFLPSVPESELVSSAANADVGVISYLSKVENHEGACPNKLSQYMQAGVMIVAVALPFVKSVVDAAGAGITFDDREPGAFAEALRRAVDDAPLRDACRVRGRAYAQAVFNYETYAPVFRALYEGRPPPLGLPHTSAMPTASGLLDVAPGSGPQIVDRDLFDRNEAENDARLALDVSSGVFSQSDVIELGRRRRELGVPRGVWTDANSLQQAVFSGDLQATVDLAGRYYTGDGVPQDWRQAFRLYCKTGDAGSTWAQYMAGVMLQEGQGVPADYQQAARWYELAGEAGHLLSLRNLGILLQVGGHGLARDLGGAFDAYSKAAEAGDTTSAINAAALALSGELGVGRYRQASQLLISAFMLGDPQAEPLIEQMISDLGLHPYLASRLERASSQFDHRLTA